MKFLRTFVVFSALTLAACVTINIYFPAEEVRNAADRIVNEVWGERAQQESEKPAAPKETPGSSLLRWLQPTTVYAAQDVDVTTPEIRALREAMKARSEALFPYLDSGHVGVGSDGLLKIRTTEGLDLKSRGEVNRLVQAENEDRLRLYREIARANGFPEKWEEVREIFARTWKDKAASGWYLEVAGDWVRK